MTAQNMREYRFPLTRIFLNKDCRFCAYTGKYGSAKICIIAYSTQWNNCKTLYLKLVSEVYLGPYQRTSTKPFAKIGTVFQLLTIFAKCSIINIWQSPKACRRVGVHCNPFLRVLPTVFNSIIYYFFKLFYPIKIFQTCHCSTHNFRDSIPVCKLRACCQDMQNFLAKQAGLLVVFNAKTV